MQILRAKAAGACSHTPRLSAANLRPAFSPIISQSCVQTALMQHNKCRTWLQDKIPSPTATVSYCLASIEYESGFQSTRLGIPASQDATIITPQKGTMTWSRQWEASPTWLSRLVHSALVVQATAVSYSLCKPPQRLKGWKKPLFLSINDCPTCCSALCHGAARVRDRATWLCSRSTNASQSPTWASCSAAPRGIALCPTHTKLYTWTGEN